jgi:hypothetical protein
MNQNYQRISSKEVKKMMNELAGKLNLAIDKKYFIEVYELNDKRAIMDFHSYGFLFNNLFEAEMYLEGISNQVTTGKIHHILEGKFKYDDSFPSEIKSLERNLLNLIGVEKVTYTQNEIQKINKFITQQLSSGKNADSLFCNLIAYVGEYMIDKLPGAKWDMTESEIANVWEPYIKENNGNRYNPFYVVYKELYEYFPEDGEIFLLDNVQVELVKYRLKIK